MTMTAEEFEFLIGKSGAIKTDITSDPRPKVKDVMMSALKSNQDDSDNDDWWLTGTGTWVHWVPMTL